MGERRSALADRPPHIPSVAAVRISEVRPASILQLSAWPDTLPTVEAVIGELLGVQAPRLGTAVADPNLTVAAVAPGRFLIAGRAPDLAPRFEAALPAEDAAVANLLHGRAILRIEGDAAALLSSCITLDLDPEVFPPGRIAQTMIHHIDVMLHRHKRAVFEVWVLRSFTEALLEWLLDAGAEIGVSFSNPGR